MITLASDCLLFRMANGESVPFSSDMVEVEMAGETGRLFDPEFVQQAAKAVFHYFRHEKGRDSVTVAEFAEAMEQVLNGFANAAQKTVTARTSEVLHSDLVRLARESGQAGELVFFPRLREELRGHVRKSPKLMRFSGLRECVKELLGAQRWGDRCRSLEEQIVSYLRHCLNAERGSTDCALRIE